MTTPAVDSRAATYTSATSAPPRTSRIESLDFVRGVVMILMAIDHVRVYSGLPPGGPTPGIFFTRWITHFVAPTFVFLAGTAAYLHGRKLNNKVALAKFLLIRGVWLVILELTVLRLAWTFNLDFAHYLLAGVIWMLGWCMILMAALVRLGVTANAVIGLAIIAGHNLAASASGGSGHPLLQILYFGGGFPIGRAGEPNFLILYSII